MESNRTEFLESLDRTYRSSADQVAMQILRDELKGEFAILRSKIDFLHSEMTAWTLICFFAMAAWVAVLVLGSR